MFIRSSLVPSLLTFATLALAPSLALADEAKRSRTVEGRGYLELEGRLFVSDSTTLSDDEGEADVTTTGYGILTRTWGVNFGFVTAEHIGVGMRLGLDNSKVEFLGQEAESTAFWALPEVRLFPTMKGSVVPYLLATAGYQRASGSGIESSLFAYGGGFGMHLFVNDGASLAPSFNLIRTTGTYESQGTSLDGSGMTFSINVGFGLWLGAGRQPQFPGVEEETTER